MVKVEHERLSAGVRVFNIPFDFQTGAALPTAFIRRARPTRPSTSGTALCQRRRAEKEDCNDREYSDISHLSYPLRFYGWNFLT
jgi:hypothetical protein